MNQFRENGLRRRATRALATGTLVAALLAGGLAAPPPAHASTTFTVDNTADPGDGTCNVNKLGCTLREAINAANADPGEDLIRFNIPNPGVQTIKPTSELPIITEAVTIDGYIQPGASPNTRAVGTDAVLKVQLDGSEAGQLFTSGLNIDASGVVVRGLAINRFSDSGIAVEGGSGNAIEGNFIGADPSGTIDHGNRADGVAISAGGPANTTVGGTSPAARNLISGNDRHGVGIRGKSAGNAVLGNLIGTKKSGTGALPNSDIGVSIFGASNNFVGGGSTGAANTIAFNGGEGVSIAASSGSLSDTNGNRVFRNSVFSNGGLGIDLGVGVPGDGPTANDAGDADVGPNGLQNKPVLTSATTSSAGTTIKGKLASSPNASFTVQFFSNLSGNEGKKFIGEKIVSTGGSGNASFTFSPAPKVATGQTITATASNNVTRDTSEFSATRAVVAQ